MLYKIVSLIGLLALITPLVHGLTETEARASPLTAYVLQDQAGKVVGNSGVRFGPIDLGITNKRMLENYGLPEPIIQKFSPFIGLTGTNAVDALKANPLKFTQEELNVIEQKFKAYWTPQFNRAPAAIRSSPQVRKKNNKIFKLIILGI